MTSHIFSHIALASFASIAIDVQNPGNTGGVGDDCGGGQHH